MFFHISIKDVPHIFAGETSMRKTPGIAFTEGAIGARCQGTWVLPEMMGLVIPFFCGKIGA